MKLNPFKKKESADERVAKLMHERRDRELSFDEQSFFIEAIKENSDLFPQVQESSRCLNLLQAAAIETEVDDSFDERVLRLARLERGRTGIRYWAPALVGCAVACLVLLSALQMVLRTATPELNPFPGSESRLIKPASRSLELFEEPHLAR